MKRIFISFLSLTALLVACNQTPQVVIETTVTGDLSNQMAYLVKAGDKATIVDSVKITGNTFQFKSDFTGKAAYSIALGKDKINTSAAVFVDTIMQYKLTLNADELNKPTQFNVVAKVDGDLENKMIYLLEEGVSSQTFLDSAIVVDNRLVLKSTYTGAAVYSLVYDKKKMPVMIFVEQAAPYALTINASDPSQSKAEGLMAKLYSEIEASNKGFETEVEPLKDALRAGDTAAMAKYRDIQTRAMANLKQFVLANSNTLAGVFVLRSEPGILETNELDSLKLTFSEELKQSKMVSRMFLLQKGNPFIDLKLKDPNNNDIAISDYAGKGKVVLLDFWASWCGPCRRENPNVVAVYNKYKSKGFEIVGISMDRNLEDWKKGIAEDKIKWPQMSDLKYWGSEAIAAYDIQGIPFTVLLDGEGKVIATNLRGEDLDKTLASLFN